MTVLLSVLGLLAVAVLTFGTAVAVGSEFSLTALERSQVDADVAARGDRQAHIVQRAHRDLSFQLSASQLLITVTTLVTGYIAEPAIATLFVPGLAALGLAEGAAATTATVLALVLATALSMVFGELVPQNLAIADPLRTARAVVWLQSGFAYAFRWLISALNAMANAIVRKLGVEPAEELRSARSPGELSSLVRASAERGTLDEGTATLLDRSLRFTDRVAEDLMTPRVRVASLDADDTVAELVAQSQKTGFSRFPVDDGDPDALVGVVHVKQAFGVPAADWAEVSLRDAGPARADRAGVAQRRHPAHPAARVGAAARRRRRRVRRHRGHRHPGGPDRGDRRRRARRARRGRASPGAAAGRRAAGSCPGCCATTRWPRPPASRCRRASTRRWPGWCWPAWAASPTSATTSTSTGGTSP